MRYSQYTGSLTELFPHLVTRYPKAQFTWADSARKPLAGAPCRHQGTLRAQAAIQKPYEPSQ